MSGTLFPDSNVFFRTSHAIGKKNPQVALRPNSSILWAMAGVQLCHSRCYAACCMLRVEHFYYGGSGFGGSGNVFVRVRGHTLFSPSIIQISLSPPPPFLKKKMKIFIEAKGGRERWGKEGVATNSLYISKSAVFPTQSRPLDFRERKKILPPPLA